VGRDLLGDSLPEAGTSIRSSHVSSKDIRIGIELINFMDDVSAMRRLFSLIIFVGLNVCLMTPGVSADGPGTNAGEVLRLSLGGYAPAMGNAFSAYAAGASSMQYNPGGLAFTARPEFEMMYQSMVEGISQGNFALAYPLGQTPNAGHGFGFDLKFIDYGSLQRTVLGSGSGISLNRTGTFSARDIATGFGYGVRYENYSLGVIGRYVSLEIDNVKATGFATDFGVQWRHPDQFLRAGLVLKNLGTTVQFDEREETIPTALRGAVSATLFQRLRINLDIELVRNGESYFNAGAEYGLFGYLPIRVGYNGRNDLESGLTFGTGFQRESLFIDYAYTPFGVFGSNHFFGLRYRF
jgi:hypothetical protein